MASESTIGTSERPLRIVIAGGGSGGHVSPAVAVIQQLREQVVLDAIWIGARPEFEGVAATELSIPFHAVRAGKLRRYLSLETIGDAFRVPFGTFQAVRLVRRFHPDVVLSTGGFVSVPSIVAAALLRIPSITHEQTAHIGLATRINARFCSVIALSFERSRASLKQTTRHVVVTGNPVRRFVTRGDAAKARSCFNLAGTLPLVYVTGGAQGARAINAAVGAILPSLLVHAELIHQCGSRSDHGDYDELLRRASQLPPELRSRYRVVERVGPELGDVYAAASLVIGRAGAGTVAELAAVGLPSILIPLPGAEEQRQNALHLVEAGAAVMIDQADLSPEGLLDHVAALLSDSARLKSMGVSAAAATIADAAERLAAEVLALVRARAS